MSKSNAGRIEADVSQIYQRALVLIDDFSAQKEYSREMYDRAMACIEELFAIGNECSKAGPEEPELYQYYYPTGRKGVDLIIRLAESTANKGEVTSAEKLLSGMIITFHRPDFKDYIPPLLSALNGLRARRTATGKDAPPLTVEQAQTCSDN